MLTYKPKCNDKKFSRLVNNLLLGKIYHFKEKVRTTQWINRHQNTIILEIKCIIINKVILSGLIWFNVCVCVCARARVHSKRKNDSWAFTKSLTELLFSFLFFFILPPFFCDGEIIQNCMVHSNLYVNLRILTFSLKFWSKVISCKIISLYDEHGSFWFFVESSWIELTY